LALEHPHWGRVELERGNNLHGRHEADGSFDIVRAGRHLERTKAPKPIWLDWQALTDIPRYGEITARVIWQAYYHRWPVEPGIRFRKERLEWNMPRFQQRARWSLALVGGAGCLAPALCSSHCSRSSSATPSSLRSPRRRFSTCSGAVCPNASKVLQCEHRRSGIGYVTPKDRVEGG
jgi:hypothetical protein